MLKLWSLFKRNSSSSTLSSFSLVSFIKSRNSSKKCLLIKNMSVSVSVCIEVGRNSYGDWDLLYICKSNSNFINHYTVL